MEEFGVLVLDSSQLFFLIALIAVMKLGKARLRLLLMSTLILPALVYGAVNIYQFYTTGASTYFSTKVLSLLLMFSVIVFGAVAAIYIKTIVGAATRIVLIVLVVALGFLLPSLSGYNLTELRLLNNESKALSSDSSNVVVDLLNKKLIFTSNLFVFKDSFEEDVISTLLVGSMSRTYPACTQSFISHKITGNREASLQDVVNCATRIPTQTTSLSHRSLISMSYIRTCFIIRT